MKESKIENAIISSADLEFAHGCLSSIVFVEAQSRTQGYGGYCLYSPEVDRGKAAGLFIWRVMQIAGVDRWSRVDGRPVRIEIKDDMIVAIGHIIKDDWLRFEQEMKS